MGVFKLSQVGFNTEASFAENAESPSSNTFGTIIPVNSFTPTLEQERIRDGAFQARSNVEALGHLGPRSASLEITVYWIGHQTTAAGALSATWLQNLLGYGLGGASSAQVGAATTGAGSATSLVTSNATFVRGGIVRLGVKGDARGDGQPGAIASVSGGTATMLTAFGAASNGTDAVYATQLAYPDESTLASLTTLRFLVSHATTGAQYHLMGGQLAGISFNLPIGGLPSITLRYTFAYWQRAATTFPSATALSSDYCAPVTGGSLYYQSVGTTTRATLTPSSVNFSVDVGLAPIPGPGGAGTYQSITGWVRTMSKPRLTMTCPWATAPETLFDLANGSYTNKHILFSTNAVDGRAVGFYMPNAFQVGNRPSAAVNENEQDYQTLDFVGTDGTDTTTELTKSAFRLWAG